jgi:DNA-binding CsgD family transcriptional regulator
MSAGGGHARPARCDQAATGADADIAARLHLGETTVKTHPGRALDKLDLRVRARAIAFAYESGLISPGAD